MSSASLTLKYTPLFLYKGKICHMYVFDRATVLRICHNQEWMLWYTEESQIYYLVICCVSLLWFDYFDLCHLLSYQVLVSHIRQHYLILTIKGHIFGDLSGNPIALERSPLRHHPKNCYIGVTDLKLGPN